MNKNFFQCEYEMSVTQTVRKIIHKFQLILKTRLGCKQITSNVKSMHISYFEVDNNVKDRRGIESP